MYTRSYNEDKEEMCLPEGYSGTALPHGVHTANEPETQPPEEQSNTKSDDALSAGIFGNFLNTPILKSIFSGFFGGGGFSLSKIGTEEILIIATAAFLFFSSGGDKECAILLLLLLFIN